MILKRMSPQKLINSSNHPIGKASTKGFTLIEVVLVLAIGGLIFLLAFLAFSQASKNRRDTQRRSDAGRLISELENYQVDTRAYPDYTAFDATFFPNYINAGTAGSFKDPSGTAYSRNSSAVSASALSIGQFVYKSGGVCDTATNWFTNTSTANVAVLFKLQKGYVCRDNK